MELPIYYWAEEPQRTSRSRLTLLERLNIWLWANPNQPEEVYRRSANAVAPLCSANTQRVPLSSHLTGRSNAGCYR